MFFNIKQDKKGFLLVEAVLAVALLVPILLGAGASFWYSQDNVLVAGQRERAVLLADEASEAVRSIRDNDFANLNNGNFQLQNNGNNWELIPGIEVIDIFSRQITIDPIDSNTKKITTNISWQQNLQRTGSLITESYLTNWLAVVNQNENFVINIANSSIGSNGDDELHGITIENTGLTDIIIDKITISWTDSNILIEKIQIDGDNVWRHNNQGTPDGRQSSGTELDIVDFTLLAESGVIDIDEIEFDGDITDNIFTIVFTLDDGTTKEVTIDMSEANLCGQEADSLDVDVSGAVITNRNKRLSGITITNTNNLCDITIDKIAITWSNNRLIGQIRIDSTIVWRHNGAGTPDGRQSSGTELDIVDYIIDSGQTDTFQRINFDGNMQGVTFSMLLTLSDGSIKTVGNFSP